MLIIAGMTVSAAKVYISPTGSDSNPGNYYSPRASLKSAWTLVTSGANDTIYMRDGLYLPTSEWIFGNKNYVKMLAYPGEIPIVDGTNCAKTTGALVRINDCNYIVLRGLVVRNYHYPGGETDSWLGLYVVNINNSRFELIDQHHCDVGMTVAGHCTNNTIINCDFHHNADVFSSPAYNNGDGMDMNTAYDPGTGYTSDSTSNNTISGCRFYWNCDDGVDLFYNNGMTNLDNNWAFLNGYRPGLTSSHRDTLLTGGDGNGFKFGLTTLSMPLVTKRIVRNCIATNNRSWGFIENNAVCRITFYNNSAYANVLGGIHLYGSGGDIVCTVMNNVSYANHTGNASYQVYLSPSSIVASNSWQVSTVTDADFISIKYQELMAPRKADGSLPDVAFLHLAANSDLMDRGTNVGISFYGENPDLGPFEYEPTTVIKSTGKFVTGTSSKFVTGDQNVFIK